MKGTVKAVNKTDFTDSYGNAYYNVEMADGTKGNYACKAGANPYFVEGQEVEYEIEVKTGKNGEYNRFKKPATDFKKGGYKHDTLGIAVGQGMNLATQMFCADKIEKGNIEATAKWFAELSYKLREELKHLDK